MMRLLLSFFIFLFCSLSYAQQTRYISDELSVFLRAGPNDKFRIIGSLNAGDKVEVIGSNEDNKYSQIIDGRGRNAWIESNLLSKNPVAKSQIPQLQQQIEDLTDKLNNSGSELQKSNQQLQQQLTQSQQTIEQLQQENQKLQQQLTDNQASITQLNNLLDNGKRDLMIQWFIYGGSVAGVGLLLGLVIPYLIPRRRSRDRWMN